MEVYSLESVQIHCQMTKRTYFLEDIGRPALENSLYLLTKLIRQRTVDQPMVERQRQMCLGTNGNCIAFHDCGHFFDRPDSQDRDLWLIDHRCRKNTAEAAKIRNRKRAALHLIGLQLTRARAGRQIDDGSLQTGYILFVGVPDHGHDQAAFERDSDADIDVP